jgi:hypothetical protein
VATNGGLFFLIDRESIPIIWLINELEKWWVQINQKSTGKHWSLVNIPNQFIIIDK